MKMNRLQIRNIIRITVILFFILCVFLERKAVWAGRIVDLIVAAPVVLVVYLIHRFCGRKLLKI